MLTFDVGKAAKRGTDELTKRLGDYLRKAITAVEEAAVIVEPIRNSIGAHLRPQNGDPAGDSVEPRVLSNHKELGGIVRIAFDDPRQSNFRSLTLNSLLFAWPDVDSDDKHEQRHAEMQKALLAAVPKSLTAIDALLVRHWRNLGVLTIPPGYDLAVADAKTGEMRNVALRDSTQQGIAAAGPPRRR